MAHDVFISYSSKDKPTADAACASLEANGIRCWIAPRDIIPGTDWGESIIDAIQDARAMILIFSSNSNTSPQIKREIERAVNKGILVVPFRIEDILPSKTLEYFISTQHWLDALSPPLEKHLQNLAANLKVLLSRKPDGEKVELKEPQFIATTTDKVEPATFETTELLSKKRRESASGDELEKGQGTTDRIPLIVLLSLVVIVAMVAGGIWWKYYSEPVKPELAKLGTSKTEIPKAELPKQPKTELPKTSAPQLTSTRLSGPQPVWSDNLNGMADSGVMSFARPRMSQSVPAAKVSSWTTATPEGTGVAQLTKIDNYIGYIGGRLQSNQGAITFEYRPLPNIAEIYAKRQPSWTNFGTNPPPQNGFLLDTIGWNAAPPGAVALVLDPRPNGNLDFVVWDGSKWHAASWKTPSGWQWDSQRWYKFGITWGPKGFGLIVDGQVKAWNAAAVFINNSIPWFLGQAPGYWPYGPHTMVGDYSQVKCYNVQLEQDK